MSHRITSPLFVGRAEELGLFQSTLTRMAGGEPGLILICGEAGVGKSRLLAEYATLARATGATVTQGACVELAAGGLPYSPMVGALGDLASRIDQATRDWLAEPARAPLRRLVPKLALPDEPLEPVLNADTRPVLFESAAGLLARLSADRALVLIVEDLHWADRSTLDLLRYVVRATRNCKLLLVAAVRTDQPSPEVDHAVAEFGRDPRVQRIDLCRLDRHETRDLIEGVLGLAPSDVLLDRIYERSEGNPFFAEELLAAGPDASGLTPGLRQVALSRVLDLSDEAQKVVRVVAVAGRPLDHARLETLCDLSEHDLIACLRESVRGYVLVSEPGSDCYSFRHAVVREVVYEDTLPGERRRLHRAHAARLTSGTPTDPAALAEVAYHLDRGRSLRAAVNAYMAAGTAAETVSAYSEAASHFERGLELLPAAAREADDGPNLPETTWIREQTARAAYLAGDPDRARELMEACVAEVDRAAEPERAALALERLGFYLSSTSDIERSVAVTTEAAELVRDLPPSANTARVLTSWARSITLLQDADVVAHAAAAQEALRVARAAGARVEEGRALGYLGSARAETDTEAGLADLREAIAISTEVHDVDSVLRFLILTMLAMDRAGDYSQTTAALQEGLAALEQYGCALPIATAALATLALGAIDTGDWKLAESLIARVSDLASPGAERSEARFAAARLAAGRGLTVESLAHLEACWAFDRDLMPERHAAVRAEILLNERRWLDARRQVEDGLSDCALAVAWTYLLGAGLRAEAELAATARLHHDDAGLEDAISHGARLIARLDETADARQPIPPNWRLYASSLLAAEDSRLHDRTDPAAWRAMLGVAETMGLTYRTIYPRFRLAEALLRAATHHLLTDGVSTGATLRAEAAAELRRAHSFAARIGARPLTEEIVALAMRARISLDESGEPKVTAAQSAPARGSAETQLARLGITAREMEVLAVVADGRTNRQIAEALFITEKTAAIHVSHILNKLGAANRVEAAATAYRLGLSVHSGGRSAG